MVEARDRRGQAPEMREHKSGLILGYAERFFTEGNKGNKDIGRPRVGKGPIG